MRPEIRIARDSGHRVNRRMKAAAHNHLHRRGFALGIACIGIQHATEELIVPRANQQDGNIGGVAIIEAVAFLFPIIVVEFVLLPFLVPTIVCRRQCHDRLARSQRGTLHQLERFLRFDGFLEGFLNRRLCLRFLA